MQCLLLSAQLAFSLASLALAAKAQEDAAFYYDRGNGFFRVEEYDKAIADFDEAIRLNPNDAAPYYDRGLVWVVAYKNFHKAISDFDQAIRLKDAYVDDCYCARALCWAGLGEHDKAIADVDHAIRVNPKNASAYRDRGDIRLDMREYDKAIADYEQAIRLLLNDRMSHDQIASAYERIAWIHATCPDPKFRDGKRAVVNAKKACESGGSKDWDILATLAAAYAESGGFDQAVDTQAKAVALVEKDKSVKAKKIAETRSRLELYKQKKPYHEEPKK